MLTARTRFHNSILIIAGLGAAGLIGAELFAPPPVRAVDDALNLFDDQANDRALIDHGPMPASGPSTAVLALDQTAIGMKYYEINPGRSVFMYDCAGAWPYCSEPSFQFPAIFGEAALIGQKQSQLSISAAYDQWLGAAAGSSGADPKVNLFLPSSFSMARPPQLMAIANRMDMARIDGNNRTGGEIHFVYGRCAGASGPCQNYPLMIILEFVIPSKTNAEFATLAADWIKLAHSDSTTYLRDLKDVLQESGFALGGKSSSGAMVTQTLATVRTRINFEYGNTWRLSQVEMGGDGKFHGIGLPQQLPATTNASIFTSIWNELAGMASMDVPNQYWSNGPSLVVNTNPNCGMGTPPGFMNPSPTIRNNLAMQQCIWCHGPESGTSFRHVQERDGGSSSELSTFLAGHDAKNGGPVLQPTLSQLYYRDSSVIPMVTINYGDYSQTGCASSLPNQTKRAFHDIARRALSLAEAVQPLTGATPTSRYSTRFVE